MKGSFTALLYALLLPVVGVALIVAFATGTSDGENLINQVGPLVLWILPIVAVIGIITKMFTGND